MPVIVLTQNTTVQSAVTPDNVYTGISEVSIRQENAGFNYDAEADLAIGNGASDNSVANFFLSALSQVPSNATINNAYARLVPGGGFGSFDVVSHSSLRVAVQSEATYNSYASGSAWQTAGARGALDRNAAVSAATTISDSASYDIPITAEIAELVTAGTDQLLIAPSVFDGDGGFRNFIKSSGTDGDRPEIVIDYTVGGSDTDPDQFTFTDQTDVAVSTLITSNTVTIAGIDAAAAISVTGGEYSIDGGAFTSAAGTINNNQTVAVRGTSSASNSTTTDVVLTIGTITDTFSMTTVAGVVFNDVTYDGSVVDYATTESFKELIETDHSDVLVNGDQVHWRITSGPTGGSTVGTDTVPDFEVGVISGEYEYTHNSVRSSTYTWQIEDFVAPTSISGNQAISLEERLPFSETYTITNPSGATTLTGPDAALFALTDNGTSVTVTRAAFDADSPEDVGGNNVYDFTLNNNSETLDVALTITQAVRTFIIDTIAPVTVNEGEAFTSVTPNISGETPVGVVAWSLGGADAGDFTIDSSTGVVSMVARSFASPVDADANNVYEYTVIATDEESNTDSASSSVTIVEVIAGQAPVITPGQSFSFDENSIVGTSIGTLALTANGTIQGVSSDNPIIAIDNALNITVAQVTSTVGQITANITATNENGTSNSVAVTFNVTDVDETVTPTAQNFTLTIDEDDASNINGGVLGQLVFTNANQPITFSGADAASFSLSGSDLTIPAALTVGTYTASYTATNSDPDGTFEQTASGTITITVNAVSAVNLAPIVSDQAFTVSDDASISDLVGLLLATDESSVTFTIEGGNTGDVFSVNGNRLEVNAPLDYQVAPSYSLACRASDGILSSTFTVSVTVLDQRVRISDSSSLADSDLRNSSFFGQLTVYQGENYEFYFKSPDLQAGWDFEVSLHKETVGSDAIYRWVGVGASIKPLLSPQDTGQLEPGDYILVARMSKLNKSDFDVIRLHVGLIG